MTDDSFPACEDRSSGAEGFGGLRPVTDGSRPSRKFFDRGIVILPIFIHFWRENEIKQRDVYILLR